MKKNKKTVSKKSDELLQARLAEKSFKLKIESALEKVRVLAVRMKKPEGMLNVCKTISQELQRLGVKEIRNVQTAVFHKEQGTYMNYEFYARHNKVFITETSYTNHKIHKAFAQKMLKGKGEFFITHMKGKKVRDWVAYQKTTNVFIDKYLYKASSLNYYWYSLGPIALGISTYHPLTDDEQDLFKRFRNVFELLYRRYLDIETAEAQAREAKIEASLEKVRAQALSMHKPEELLNVCKVLFKELLGLGFTHLRNVIIHSFNDKEKYFIDYDYADHTGGSITNISYDANRIVGKFIRQIRKSDNEFVEIVITGKELSDWRKFRKKGGQPDDLLLNKAASINYYLYSIPNASIGISTFNAISEEKLQLLKRFRNVFDFAYRRYIDVAQAEAQAREAQIELGLERVRARAMAMQRSEELDVVIKTVYSELKHLDVSFYRCFIMIFDEQKGATWWMGSPDDDLFHEGFYVQYHTHPPHLAYLKGWEDRQKKWEYRLAGQIKKDWDEFIFNATGLSKLPPIVIQDMKSYEFAHLSASFENFGCITTGGQEGISEKSFDILSRFAKVFDQTYTRFNDLKNAEAQAREAQIETALERVRSRTMAMHQTSELQAVIHTVHNELLNLNLSIYGGSFVVINDDVGAELRCWGSGGTANTSEEVQVPHFNMPFCTNLIKGIKSGPCFFTEEFSQKDKKKYFTKLFTQKPWSDLSSEQKKETLSSLGGYTRSVAVSKHTTIFIINHSGRKFTEAENDILRRFAKVFDQTYTRFLDLKNAEAQAREAQIQLALERVRARTMAMQKSNELAETSLLLFQQFKDLGETSEQISIGIFKEDENIMELYSTLYGSQWKDAARVDLKEPIVMKKIHYAWKKQKKSLVIDLTGKELQEYNAYRKKISNLKFTEDRWVIHMAFFSRGVLTFSATEPHPQQTIQLLERFSGVFDQTYTRFLDLQKAEAQTRESQIELGLERVRARAMAMRTSEELNALIGTVFTELTRLDLILTRCVILIYEGNEKGCRWWMANSEAPSTPMNFFVKYADMPFFNEYLKGWHDRSLKWQYILAGENKIKTDDFLFNKTELSRLPDFVITGMKAPQRVYLNASFNNFGNLTLASLEPLSDEHFEILLRFAKVFDLTYTRFNDLQKAEAQAREAQIEAALERVRARTMAMQKSDELKYAATLLFQQVKALGVPAYSCGYNIWETGEKEFTSWMSTQDGTDINGVPNIPLTEDANFIRFDESRKKGEPFFVLELRGERMQEHYQYLKTIPAFKAYFDYAVSVGFDLPKTQIHHIANFSQGNLLFITLETCPEFHDVFKRFAAVFEQTYTRFLDLQRAEAQARESQIQLALERVRARTMAMQKSDELPETSHILFEQMKELGEPVEQLTIGVVQEENNVIEISATLHGDILKKIYQHSIDEPFMMSKIYHAWKTQQKTLIIELKGEELNAYNKYRNKLTKSEMFPTNLGDEHRRIVYAAFFSKGMLALGANEPRPPESLQLLERFAGVFDQAYTRFLDLKNAEAQAREAQIETALERVRSRSMGMQKSEELKEVIQIVYEQFDHLNIHVEHTGFIMDYKERDDMHIWLADKNAVPFQVTIPYFDCAHWNSFNDAKKNGKDFFANHLSFEEKNKFYHDLFKLIPGVPEETLEYYFSCPGLAISTVLLENVGLYIENFSGIPYSNEENNILMRFGKVFQQTYTRFLDLQKAEAQARESQIQLALERVRARTMAMQHSNELQEVVNNVYERLNELEVEMDGAAICTFIEDSKDYHVWIGGLPEKLRIKFNDLTQVQRDYNDVIERRDELFTKTYSGKIKNEYISFLLEKTVLKSTLPEDQKQMLMASDFFTTVISCTKNTAFQLYRYNGKPFQVEETDILKRFAKVFEQAYIRFLDLQKAEAQARESQIEASLEKVRASAMAMHNSNDISATTNIVFAELKKLDIHSKRCGVCLLSKNSRTADVYAAATSSDGEFHTLRRSIEMTQHPSQVQQYESWLTQRNYISVLSGQELKSYYQLPFFNSSPSYVPPENYDHEEYGYYIPFSEGLFYAWTESSYSDSEMNILNRFKSIIELTFRRYFDLQKAERQAREAKIEASLERVRAKAMAMHKSEDLNSAVATVFEELDKLDLGMARCGIGILDKEKRSADVYTTTISDNGTVVQVSGDEAMDIHPLLKGAFETWLKGEEDFSYVLQGEDLVEYYKAITHANFKLPESQLILSKSEVQHYYYVTTFQAGGLFAFRDTPFPEEAKTVMKRFANVFNLTYKRFLDLQKAEAQAREAQIEASLERVRSKAMAMHSSKDLSDTIGVFYRELKSLGVIPRRCGVALMDKEERLAEVTTMNTTEQGDSIEVIGHIKMEGHKILDDVYENWLHQKEYHAVLRGNEIKEYYRVLKPQVSYPDYPNDVVQYGYYFMFKEGDVYAWTEKEMSEDELKIYRRFTTVISLTYKRYKDLQQAEVQAREATIEAAMEKVRARAMAMQKADELVDVAQLLRKEMSLLGVEDLETSSIYIHNEETGTTECWYAIKDEKKLVADHMTIDLNDTWVGRQMYEYYRSDKKQVSIVMQGNNRKEWINYCSEKSRSLSGFYGDTIPDRTYHLYKFSNGYMGAASPGDISAESWSLLQRATTVFSLAYTRFNDLQQAEAQAREATIEAALEKVRGKAMAMHNSNDLSVTTSMIISELKKLGIRPIRCGVGIINKETHKAQLYTATSSIDGDHLSVVGWVLLKGHPVLENIYEKFVEDEDYFPELSGDLRKSYYEQLLAGLSVPLPDFKDEQKHYGHFFSVSVGCLYAWSDVRYSDDEIKILKRFASIVDLTFRRYFELQKSEENAKEAVKQAALDRIRADIASMRTVADLDRITPLIWNELTILEIPFIRCGVFIMDEEQQLIHTFLSTPDGKAIAAFHLPYDTPGNISRVIDHWRRKKIYTDHWDEEEFTQFADILMKQGALTSREQYLKTIPQGGFHLHFLPFLQGMLYVGNTEQLSDEQIELIQHVANAFSTAYARYEDFNKLEAAKQQVEKTLTVLKQAQQQLVQSEKMASLGELTAGIAHEIQNPLNFVNNFSEVSNELFDEMIAELDSGDDEEAKAIAHDIKQNLEKITHHGKRADAIVKGMLQHSRTSSGQKELTDINALADEYLRLAYHGLRAKDKSFNAKFETHFDNSIEKIYVIPQDIGRVILNLINNAFYAVTEKKKQIADVYEPTVTVTTLKDNGRIEIKVKDNGNGISQKNIDKIFQPFFTTKPTGQGTGLGLSLAYDIITKGHGGELSVETKDREGSEFIISLPKA